MVGGPQLTFAEVQQLVEEACPAVRLELDEGADSLSPGSGKGRFLVARRALRAGEAFLSEQPLFQGSCAGLQSQRAFTEAFSVLLDTEEEEDTRDEEEFVDWEEDCFHPGSPLVDCVAGVVLTKAHAERSNGSQGERAEAKLRLRKLRSLHQVDLPDVLPEEFGRDLFGVLRPELQEITSVEEVCSFLLSICSNRFGCGGTDSQLDLMFAGSMLEHSCLPNCFVGNWRGCTGRSRCYRALRDVEPGEALSVDYLMLPDSYLPTAARAELLARWGFVCSCPRCLGEPELTRCFVCASCGSSELCPAAAGEPQRLECRACGARAAELHEGRCLEQEAAVLAEGIPSEPAGSLLGKYHHASLANLWPRAVAGCASQAELELLAGAVSRLYSNPRHPHLLELYHALAELEHDDLEAQMQFLELERTVLRRYYPEDAARLDDDIIKLVQGRGPHSSHEDAAPESPVESFGTDFSNFRAMQLSTMD